MFLNDYNENVLLARLVAPARIALAARAIFAPVRRDVLALAVSCGLLFGCGLSIGTGLRHGAGGGLHPDFGTEWEDAPNGIPFVVVGNGQRKVAVDLVAWPEESDPGPYPIPDDAPIEGGPDSEGDRHVLVTAATRGCSTSSAARSGRRAAGRRTAARCGT
jgi:hypothetical protein